MRLLAFVLPAAVLLGCAPGAEPGAEADARQQCLAQDHAPGTDAFRVCLEADGAAIATGPGSPYANADEEEGGL